MALHRGKEKEERGLNYGALFYEMPTAGLPFFNKSFDNFEPYNKNGDDITV